MKNIDLMQNKDASFLLKEIKRVRAQIEALQGSESRGEHEIARCKQELCALLAALEGGGDA